ncbi:phospholipase effector Tle1 domain-containing protein [Pseudomonas sp. NPDC089401]|uniref:phospholipase effector Tle1 domain-containing protein n=1 Tax=Pseudomonas sp. NPDC089401 TaxID=3364462 RepID=UPI0037F8ED02
MRFLVCVPFKRLSHIGLLLLAAWLSACTHSSPAKTAAAPLLPDSQTAQVGGALSIPAHCIKPDDIDLSNGEPDDNYYKVKTRWQQLNCRYADPPSRSLLVFLDGTANNKKSSTNIWRLYDLALTAADSGSRIVPYYDQGVGNDKLSKVSGNLFGSGVSLNIRQAYRFLAQTYRPGDRIYLFGFSRGAFTARSLNGFIEFAGLINDQALAKDWGDDLPFWLGLSHLHRATDDLYDIYFSRDTGAARFEPILREQLRRFVVDKQLPVRHVQVEAIGVFDTVPAIGLVRDEEPDDHRLALYARRGYHAMSLDEQRDDFRLLRFFAPLSKGQTLQEVWFAGVHADVGGGYGSPALSRCPPRPGLPANQQPIGLEATPLRWMLANFDDDGIFPAAPWPECLNGRLHDEFLDSSGIRKRVFRISGLIKRHPVTGDQVHKSVLCRMHLLIAEPVRHPEREPDGRYVPANLGAEPELQHQFQFLPVSPDYRCP